VPKTVDGVEKALHLIIAATGKDYPHLKITCADLRRRAAANGHDPGSFPT
jgi:hypothetical protein